MSNPFFERNTISNWTAHQQESGPPKIRAKRARSVAQLKINPSKFQHREVFDGQLYQKAKFFRCGFDELKDYNKKEEDKALEYLQIVLE